MNSDDDSSTLSVKVISNSQFAS